jgi:amino acid adenylation domain-containing protein
MADQARVAAILSDADMPVLPGFTDRTHRLPGILAEDVQDMATPMPDARPDDLACVIFTSGSTGTPKGAMLEHRNLVNYLLFLQEEYRLSSDLRTLHRTPYSFDPCLYELLLPISCGGASVIAAPGMENDSTHIIDTVTSLQVTYLFFTPAQLKVFLQEQDIHRLDGTLRIIQCAGEALDETTMRICLDTLGASLSNAYGPAEAGAVTQWICHNGHEYPNPSIGRPNVHVDILILDAQGRPVPPGLPGELWIGGAQTGRGYIHNPEETAKRFVDDPLRPGSGRRYYRTGDLARFLPDGNLLFLGRLDDQVKVRGVRIEPGDVAAGLQHCKGVSQAVVLPEPDGEGSQRLRAWVTPQPDTSLSEAAIRAELAARLPAYMVPFRIHVIDAVPLTMNGKTDHRALRALAEADEGLTPEGLPLTTPTQHRLAHLWSQLLRVEVRYADADFFRLGGHSLHLMRLLQSIRHVWGVSPDLQTLLEASSLEDMAARIDAHRQPSDQHAAGVPTTLRLWEADGTGGMYFCDGGLGNNVRIVKTLATRQGWTWNTYHIPTPHLHPVGSGETSLEAITERYVETILDVHVDGPIVLVGFCLAGLEAHATACRLQQTSPHPVHLILIDTVHPDGLAMPGRIDPKDPDTDTATGDVTRHIGVRKPTMDIDALEGIGREAVARGILDPEWYLHRNPDVADAGVDPAIHYLAEGWREGRLPSPWFHADTYALLEPGFRAQHPDPVRHFLNVGMQRPSTHRGIMGMAIRWKQMEKGDVPHRIFDADWHLARYPEIADGPYPPLTHYVLHGWAEHRTPALHFDKWVYHAICRGFDPFRHNPVLHYLLIGQYDPVVEKAVRTLTSSPAEAEALVAGGWFEPEAYARRYADTRLLGRPGLDHFMSIGWRYARSPFTGYDPDAFARQFPGFIPDQQNPLRHLLELGSLPIRVGTIPETARAEASPTSDLAPSPLNSATIASNPPNASVAQEEMGPAEREFLVALGRIRKGYRPAFFSGRIYLCANQHLYNVDPLLGWTEGLHGHIQSHPLRGGHDTILGDDLEANADIFRSILEGIFASTS